MTNFLEQLVAEWYEFQGYFVRRNVRVGKRLNGGHEGELDVVAFHPSKGRLIHIEPSMDCDPWDKREARFSRKFKTGRTYIPMLFEGFSLPAEIEQVALLMYGSSKDHSTLGGKRLMMIDEFMANVRKEIEGRQIRNAAIPEQFILLRTLQFAATYWK
ncbi:MAG: hypothetical protein PHS57_03705 [Alphaproteobacteria bacterium]|nr:hypothetical protein [Alphaproteobacteria bacterium]